MSLKKYVAKHEIEYIRQNCTSQTDEQIATYLKRNIRTIKKVRQKLGLAKGGNGVIKAFDPELLGVSDVSKFKMSESDKKKFFTTRLSNTLFYQYTKSQLTEEEINFYMEEWASLCIQFEDVVATERRQIDELIKAEVIGNRILRNIRIVEEEIEKLQEEVKLLRKTTNINDNEALQIRDDKIIMMVKMLSSQSSAMVIDYQKNVDLKNKILSELNARRKDRVEQITKKSTTFVGLIESFRERETREKEGRYMELLNLSREKKKSQWRKPNVFPDGSRDPILLDENSVVECRESVLKQNFGCSFINDFKNSPAEYALIIEDDPSRQQLFQEILPKKKLFFCSTAEKAKEFLKDNQKSITFVSLDFDLGLNQKGSEIARHIYENGLLKGANIVIHSLNKDGTKEIVDILSGNRNIEIFTFNEMVEFYLKTEEKREILKDNKAL
jgi:hypothetical protein